MLKAIKSSFALRIVLIVFLCLLFSSAFTLSMGMLLIWLNVRIPPLHFMMYILSAFAISCVVGTFLAVFISRRFSASHNKFKRALKEVANGNFDVIVKEENILYGEIAHDFNAMVKELKSLQVLRNDFISNFSHEFKTPVSAINGFAELLAEPNVSDDERIEYAQIICKESARLLKLSKNTLLLSKIDGRQIISDKHNFSLNGLIENTLLLFEKQLAQKNISVNTQLEKINYFWDEDLLSQVFINLFSNAIKYGKEGGNLSVTLKNQKETVEITVIDNGIGMDEKTKARMFERYFQGDASHRADGNGLGLAITEKIVLLCGGKITVQSELDMGTTVTVTLPQIKH